MDTFITYEGLPISSGGAHSLGNKSIDKLYSNTLKFIDNLTDAKYPKKIDLTFYVSQNGKYKTFPILWDLVKKLGFPSRGSWDLKTNKQVFYSFKVTDIKNAFSILEKYSGLPDNEYEPIVVSLMWHFQFIDPKTRATLPGQNEIPILDERHHNSQVYLRLGRRSSISAWLTFPFSSLNENATNYIELVSNYLPFKPSNKHWRIWKQSINGNWTPKTLTLNAS